MSVQLAKSGTNATPGRRTPLSLSGSAGGKSGKSGSPAAAGVGAVEKSDGSEKSANNDIEEKKPSKSDLNEKPVAAAAGVAGQSKKDENLQENGYTNGHNRNDMKEDNNKQKTISESTAEKKEISPRTKDKQQRDEKVTESPRKTETRSSDRVAKKNEKGKEKNLGLEENEKKNSSEKSGGKKDLPAEAEKKEKPEKKTSQDSATEAAKKDNKKQESVAETASKEEKKTKEPVVISKEEKKSQDNVTVGASAKDDESSINRDQLFSDQKCDDMEPLVFEGDGETPGYPDASSTPGKVLKRRQGPLNADHLSAIQRDKPELLAPSAVARNDTPSQESPAVSLSISRPGRISGRRSIRPIREISFENRYPGTYRQILDEDRWPSSMNVTVGSEIPNETASSSFSFFSRGKKRERTPPPISNIMGSQDSELSPKSPKRARLDFSGLLGIMASPVTMLRAKFSRTKIQSSSTPNGKMTNKRGGGSSEDDVVNVSGIAAEDVAAATDDVVVGGNGSGDVSIQDAVELTEDNAAINKDTVDRNLDFQTVEGKSNENNADDADDDIGTKENVLEAASTESVNKRKMCNVM